MNKPIETIKEGNKTTKIVVEDFYKPLNRVIEAMDKSYNDAMKILDSVHKEYNEIEGELVIGTGISQPCLTDAYDEEIGNNIAFMKAKLNANIKKLNILRRAFYTYNTMIQAFDKEFLKLEENIRRDLYGIRNYNSEYLEGIENKLGIG